MADLHLETTFAHDLSPPALGLERRGALRRALRRILGIAKERDVQAITIAGDLYDQDYVLPEISEVLIKEFSNIAPIHVYISPGEHDPYVDPSIYTTTRWPDNVTVFSPGQPPRIELAPDLHLVGLALPYGRDRAAWQTALSDRAGINILLAHGLDSDTESALRSDIYPINVERVEVAGFDLALLGHEHGERAWPADQPRCVYPGSPELLSREEAGARHTVVLVTIEGANISLEPIPVSTWRYFSISVDLTGCESMREVVRRVEEGLDNVGTRHDRAADYTVRLTGLPSCDVTISSLAEQVETKAHLIFQIEFDPPGALVDLAKERTVRGMLSTQALKRLDEADNEVDRSREIRIARFALEALSGKQGGFDALR